MFPETGEQAEKREKREGFFRGPERMSFSGFDSVLSRVFWEADRGIKCIAVSGPRRNEIILVRVGENSAWGEKSECAIMIQLGHR